MRDFLIENVDFIIAIFTTFFAVAGMQFRNMRVILVSQLISNGLLALQCILGGTASAGGIVFLAIGQTVVSFIFSAKGKRFPLPLTIVFMAGFTAITVIYFSTPFDLLTMVAAWFFALAIVQERSHICRFYSLVNTVLWLVYDFFVMPSGVVNHSVIAVLIFASILRLDRGEWKQLLTSAKEKLARGKKNATEETVEKEKEEIS